MVERASDVFSRYACSTTTLLMRDTQFNVFRLPVPWQKLVGNDLETNKLDQDFFGQYNDLVQICLDSSAEAHCM